MAKSNFSTNLSGWTTSNGTETYSGSDGNPGGSVRGVEGGSGTWYFLAPTSYLGNQSAFYGGSISFDLRQDITTSQFDGGDVILTGGGLTLVLDIGDNPGTDWTSYSASLALGGGWKVGSVTGSVATEAEIRAVLGDLQSLAIRGEFVLGAAGDASNLDNVAMTKLPAESPEFVGPKISSTFNADTEGWAFIADVKEFDWVASGGNPGGYLEAVDFTTGEVWYFVAPTKFLGDKTAYSGGNLQFDLKQSSTTSQFNDEDVVISGGGLTIAIDLAGNPDVDWTHYSVGLDTTSDWRIGTLGGAVATQAEIDSVLSDITNLHIRGEYVAGNDTGGIDNVVMSSVNAPVRVLGDTTIGTLLSSHAQLGDALAVTERGNLIQINKASAAPLDQYDVSGNGLTVFSDQPLDATLNLLGVRSISLTGDNDLNVNGNAKDNRITGSDGNNKLNGFGGDDVIKGHGGRDVIKGHSGRDVLSGGDGRDTVKGGGGNDIVRGNTGVDKLFGQNGADKLFGGSGADILNGGRGQDRLSGDKGDDTLSGGADSDIFLFKDGFGVDTINDFDALDNREKIDLSKVSSIADFTDLVDNHMSQSGTSVVIDDLSGNTITLTDTALADLGNADFLF